MRDELFQLVVRQASTVRQKNVLNPLLWLAAIALPTFLAASAIAGFSSTMGVVFAVVPIFVVVAVVGFYCYFSIRDPDRLQSEEYQLKRQELRLASKRGEEVLPTEDEYLLNPKLADEDTPRLPLRQRSKDE